MTVRTALNQANKLLEEAGIAAPRLTAEVLLAHILGRDRSYLYAHSEEDFDAAAFQAALDVRMAGTPTQYITGRQEFYGREFLVTPDVFIPRPETEHVIETALARASQARTVLDAGCGSGAIAITLSLEMKAQVLATDVSLAALRVARRNACHLEARVEFVACDLASAAADHSLDLLVSNPPYIPLTEEPGLPREVREHEPRTALFAGPEGLDAYRRLIAEAPRVLRLGGWIAFELGYRQADAVRSMLDPRWSDVEIVCDLAGLPRVITGRLSRDA